MNYLKSCQIILLLGIIYLLFIPNISASQPIKALDVINLGNDKGAYKYNELIVNIDFPNKEQSPLYTISFTPNTNNVFFGLVDIYQYGYDKKSYMVSENGSVNVSANLSLPLYEKEPDVTAPIIYKGYSEKSNTQGGILGWHYLLSSTTNTLNDYNTELMNSGHPYLSFYGYLLPMNVTRNEKVIISFRRISDFKGFNTFLFPFVIGNIKLNLLLTETTSFSNIQIIKNDYPDWLISYKYEANKFYINKNVNLPLKEDAEFIRYSSENFLNKNFERSSILSLDIKFGLKPWIVILSLLFYLVSSLIVFLELRRYKKSMWIFFSYQFLIFVALHAKIYPELGIEQIFFTVLDFLLVLINITAFILFKKYKLLN